MAGDGNLSRYVGNAPTYLVDPSGLVEEAGQGTQIAVGEDSCSLWDKLAEWGRSFFGKSSPERDRVNSLAWGGYGYTASSGNPGTQEQRDFWGMIGGAAAGGAIIGAAAGAAGPAAAAKFVAEEAVDSAVEAATGVNVPVSPVDLLGDLARKSGKKAGKELLEDSIPDGEDVVDWPKPFDNYEDWAKSLNPPPPVGKELVPKPKRRKPGLSGKEAATDIPSWAEGAVPNVGESGSDFARRMLDPKYGRGSYPTGPGSEFSKLRKFADRAFE